MPRDINKVKDLASNLRGPSGWSRQTILAPTMLLVAAVGFVLLIV